MSPPPITRQMVIDQLGPGSGKPIWMEVKGFSMYPSLRPGDRVEVEGASPADFRLGDLAVVDAGEAGWVIHRFFGWRAGQPRLPHTKGDASPRFDPVWAGARLLGRVRAFERGGRRHPVRRGWSTLPWVVRSLLVLVWGRLRNLCPAGTPR